MSQILVRLHDLAEAERSTWGKSNAKMIEGKSTIHLLQLSNKSCWLICLNSRLVGVFERRCAAIAESSLPFSNGSESFISRLLLFLPGLRVFGSPARKSGFIHPHTLLPQTRALDSPSLCFGTLGCHSDRLVCRFRFIFLRMICAPTVNFPHRIDVWDRL